MSFVLRKYQVEAVEAGVRFFKSSVKENHIQILPTGAGKSLIVANIAKELSGNTLIFQPSKEILEQNLAKYKAYGNKASVYSASMGSKEISKVTFATIGSVKNKSHLFEEFQNIIVDECFPAGTLVDGKPIEEIKIGDSVKSFNHDLGLLQYRRVLNVFKNENKSPLLKVRLEDGTVFVCTENHPVFIKEIGYIPAKLLSLCSTEVLSTFKIQKHEQKNNPPLSNMRSRVQKEGSRQKQSYLLHQIVRLRGNKTKAKQKRSRLFALWGKYYNRGAQALEISKKRKSLLLKRLLKHCSEESLNRRRQTDPRHSGMEKEGLGQNEIQESNVGAWQQGKNDRVIQRTDILPGKRREWKAIRATNDAPRSDKAYDGIPHKYKSCSTFIYSHPESLQSGSCMSRKESVDRSGRKISCWRKNSPRQKKDCGVECVRVESVEIFEQGGEGKLEGMRRNNHVYNIEVDGNHNYFANEVLVHNCDLVGSKKGMYKNFIESLPGAKVLGLTATPYRLTNDNWGGAMLKFITRTRPRVFSDVNYYVQNQLLFDQGYLAPIKYFSVKGFNRKGLKVNTTGSNYTDQSVKDYYKSISFPDKVVKVVNRLLEIGRKNVLVFTSFIHESAYLITKIPGAAIVTSKTPKEQREQIISDFRSGKIKVLCNVGIMTIGVDIPQLETIVMARATLSLRLWYQITGRGIRLHPDKDHLMMVDMCGNREMFGDIESLHLNEMPGGKWFLSNKGRILTNRYFQNDFVPLGR